MDGLNETAGKILFVLPAFFTAGAIFYLSSLENVELPLEGLSFNDLLCHFGAYYVFGLTLLIAAYPWYGHAAYPLKTHALLIAVGLLYALSDEIHQSFVPNRTCAVSDFLADALGIVAALASGGLWIRKRGRP